MSEITIIAVAIARIRSRRGSAAHPQSRPWRDHPPGHTPHIIAMGGSYTVLLTAFYVDNGKNLPLWDKLPTVAYWLLPAIAATPLIARSIHRHRRPPATPAPRKAAG